MRATARRSDSGHRWLFGGPAVALLVAACGSGGGSGTGDAATNSAGREGGEATGGALGTGGAPSGGAGRGGATDTGGNGPTPGTGGLSGSAGTSGGGRGGSASTGGRGGGAGAGAGGMALGTAGAGGGPSATCARWKADRADLSEGSWTGNLAACTAGDVTGVGRPNTLRQVNLFRFIAGLPPVAEDATKDQNAQSCALLLDANQMLSHTPPASWTCYTAAGAAAAGQSNIATTAGVRAVGLYMTDGGNETTIGHRRWLLSNSLGPVGMGSTAKYSCLMTLGGSGNAGKAFAAWPPPGEVPLQAIKLEGSVDAVGWSIQSDTINLANAQVTVTDGGAALAVSTSQLPANYGSKYAIRIVPMGWTSAVGHTYSVSVAGTTPVINYAVSVVSCP